MNNTNTETNNVLVVVLNETPVLEYNRNKILSTKQLESLKLMDERLEQGITLEKKLISHPSLEQRIEFVSANLVSALLKDEEVLAAASCAYIANHLPELKQIKAVTKDEQVSIELIFDREYQQEMKMDYTPLDKLTRQQH